LFCSPIGCKSDLDLGNGVIRMINTSKQDIRNIIKDLQDMHESKAQEGNQARHKGCEESEKGEDSRESDPKCTKRRTSLT
jgi:hypothetical protein